jgi:uncharacterized protein (DUF1697 family)
METWVALLRGINVGGKRPIPMRGLREAFAEMGYVDPETYIQSGNVIVGSRRPRSSRTVPTIERRLAGAFGHDVRVVVRDFAEMTAIVRMAPADWEPDDRSTRRYVMFLTDGSDARAILRTLRPRPEFESVSAGRNVLYWSAPERTITRTAMVKLSAHPAYAEMTVRNLRTTLKVHELMRRRHGAA